ncbi:MAG TPA: 2-hydroxyacyl-CoA dehydratase family protein [Anaeromyxobacteraceae bacterium]|nr:2-hydroxyacyl-CoA dehydratase family protein [Anaeromyxobacteraceae bacterium]
MTQPSEVKPKRAGYFCVYTPIELLAAAGATPVRLFKGGDADVVNSGEVHTRSFFCQFAQYSVGAFREGDPLYRSIDKLYHFNTCDQMKKGVEAIGEFFGVPYRMLCLPRERSRAASREFMQREVEFLRRDVEELTGQAVTEAGLREQIARYNRARRWLREISELRKRDDPPLTGGEYLELVKAFYYLPIDKALAAFESLHGQLSAEVESGDRPLRIMVAGGIVADGDDRLTRLLEDELDTRIVVEDHCTGLRPFYLPVPEDRPPLQALAEGYLDQAPCARMKPLSERLDFSEQLAREYRVDAIVYVSLKFCSCYAITGNSFVKRFEKLGIPVLEISSDYSESDLGQLKTRLGAFLELLKKGDADVRHRAGTRRAAVAAP